jgi:AcrR family transcriptional regulator
VTTAAVSERSGAPTGSLYHRFGSRSAMVAELWVRTVRQFQDELLSAAEAAQPGLERALTVAGAIMDFSSRRAEDARLMLLASREELSDDPTIPADLAAALRTLDDPTDELAKQLVRELYGRLSPVGLDKVVIAVYGLPYAAVRRCLLQGKDPVRLKPLVQHAARAVLAGT